MIALNTAESGTITIIIDESFKIDFYELRWAAIAGAGERDVKTSSREKNDFKVEGFSFPFSTVASTAWSSRVGECCRLNTGT